MKLPRLLCAFSALSFASWLTAQEVRPPTPADVFSGALSRIAQIIEPPAGTPPQTFTTRLKITRADGAPKELLGREIELAFQAPDRARLVVQLDKDVYRLGRHGQQLWIHAPAKKFGVVGQSGVPRFSSSPEKLDTEKMKPVKLPIAREQLGLLPLLCKVEVAPDEKLEGVNCRVLRATPQPAAVEALKIPAGTLHLWIRQTDGLPARLGWSDEKGLHVLVDLQQAKLGAPWPAGNWQLAAGADEKIETVALSHLTRFIPMAIANLSNEVSPLPPANGERRVVATHGNGRLELHDATRVLFLKGTPEEMGEQHGTLLKPQVRDLVERVLYGVGVASSFSKGTWFFHEIEGALKRFGPFVDARYTREMDALALAAGVDRDEARLANFFPELFHCSGFAVWGDATVGGRMYHGRVLDYMKGIGLEQNAAVIVFQPDQGHAWVNVSYAGFVGSVTAMNSKHIGIGEMGGRGEGQWDGKPMAQLMREVMEKASTLDEAVGILRRGPRTCEYFYVITDGKTKRAVGIAATPATFEVIQPNQAHPQLPHPVRDAVLMSAGDRYEELVRRVKSGFGKLDAAGARDLMTRPVCMTSNIHSVLFAPDTLEFWVANSDSKNVASHTRYTRYNLAELLRAQPVAPSAAGSNN